MSLGRWTAGRVSLVAVGWILGVAVFFVWRAYTLLKPVGSGGIAAVSIGVAQLLVPMFGPPLALVLVWLGLRRRIAGER